MSIDYSDGRRAGIEEAAAVLTMVSQVSGIAIGTRITLALAARIIRQHLLLEVPLDQIVNLTGPARSENVGKP